MLNQHRGLTLRSSKGSGSAPLCIHEVSLSASFSASVSSQGAGARFDLISSRRTISGFLAALHCLPLSVSLSLSLSLSLSHTHTHTHTHARTHAHTHITLIHTQTNSYTQRCTAKVRSCSWQLQTFQCHTTLSASAQQ